MGGRAAHVQFFDGRAVTGPARGRTQEEELLERQLTLKNISFGQAGGALDVERSDELLTDDQTFQIRGVLRNGIDDGVAEGFALLVPGAGREFVRRVLHEAGQDVFSGRRDGWISERGDDHVDVGTAGKFAVLGLIIGAFHIFHGRRNGNGAAQMISGAGQASEIGQAIEREIYFAGRAAEFVAAEVFEEIAGKVALFDKFQEGEIGVDAGRNDVGVNFFAGTFEDDAAGDTILDQNFGDGGFFANFNTGFDGGCADGVGDGASAAAAETPGAESAVDFAHVMVEQNVGGAGRTNAEESADDSGGGHGGFERVGFKPLVEEIGGAHVHELDEIVFVFGFEILETLAEEGEFFQVARIERGGIRRDHGQNWFDEAAHGDHGLAKFFVGFGVEFRVAFEFAAGFAVIVLAPEVIAVGHGGDGAVERKNFQAVAREIEVANDFGAQQGDDVGINGKFEAGNDFFGDGGAAEDVTLFEDEDFFAGFGEVRRVDQAVVAAADYDDVVFFGHENFRCSRGRKGTEKNAPRGT